MTENEYRTELRKKLIQSFDLSELNMLCTDLSIDPENVAGANAKKYEKAEGLIGYVFRHGLVSTFVKKCQEIRPNITWTADYLANIFLCYSRKGAKDRNLVKLLNQKLSEKGHEVFIDEGMRGGTQWLEEIDQQIQRANFVIVLISEKSAQSEMLQAEVHRAYEYRQKQGRPQILPIRVNYEEMLPYSMAAFLNTTQYILWQTEADDNKVVEDVLKAIQLHLPDQPKIEYIPPAKTQILLEDGRPVNSETSPNPPAPEFDPRFIEDLVPPGGTVKLNDEFYIERSLDIDLRRQILRPGSITTIRASRQTGKSSLLVRGIHYAKENARQTILLDFQRLDEDSLIDADKFLHILATSIVHKLRLDTEEVAEAWRGPLGAQEKLSGLMEDYILPCMKTPLVLAIDEADRLLSTDFHTSFFGLIRSWHNNAAYDEVWQKLTIAMVISTEPYLLISDVNQSPFNVGAKLYLKDFSEEQVFDLNHRYGSPVSESNFVAFMQLFGGHPYLTRMALYTLVKDKPNWDSFLKNAPTDKGPFGDHLRRQLWLLRKEPELQDTLRQAVTSKPCSNELAQFRLLRAGLVKGSGDVCQCRCDLYRQYFDGRL